MFLLGLLSNGIRLILSRMELFLWPLVFLLLPLPLIVRRLFSRADSQSEQQTTIVALRVPFYNQVGDFAVTNAGNTPCKTKWPLILTWILCVCAAARPIWYDMAQSMPQNARNVVLALDTSGSMQEDDFDINGKPVTRLDLVKNVVNDFIQKRTGDEISLVVFGSEAYTYTPLTYDLKTVQSLLNEVNIGMAGEMTAIGDALATGIANVAKLPADSRIVILLSDGNTNAGVVQVSEAIKMAQKTDVKVYTIGIASKPRKVRDFFGFEQVVDPAADLDEKTLNQIAQATGGRYFRATTTPELKGIYDTIDSLEKSEHDGQLFRPRKELFYMPLMGAILCFLIAYYKRRFK